MHVVLQCVTVSRTAAVAAIAAVAAPAVLER